MEVLVTSLCGVDTHRDTMAIHSLIVGSLHFLADFLGKSQFSPMLHSWFICDTVRFLAKSVAGCSWQGIILWDAWIETPQAAWIASSG